MKAVTQHTFIRGLQFLNIINAIKKLKVVSVSFKQ